MNLISRFLVWELLQDVLLLLKLVKGVAIFFISGSGMQKQAGRAIGWSTIMIEKVCEICSILNVYQLWIRLRVNWASRLMFAMLRSSRRITSSMCRAFTHGQDGVHQPWFIKRRTFTACLKFKATAIRWLFNGIMCMMKNLFSFRNQSIGLLNMYLKGGNLANSRIESLLEDHALDKY